MMTMTVPVIPKKNMRNSAAGILPLFRVVDRFCLMNQTMMIPEDIPLPSIRLIWSLPMMTGTMMKILKMKIK